MDRKRRSLLTNKHSRGLRATPSLSRPGAISYSHPIRHSSNPVHPSPSRVPKLPHRRAQGPGLGLQPVHANPNRRRANRRPIRRRAILPLQIRRETRAVRKQRSARGRGPQQYRARKGPS
ncbi:hypothetical protein GCM10007857_16080 [Bradyrhizobium iriomotense]|uniref:Uncharacterized protein n=1 Tax=Bradyrhizobium iriomotense TaxID=441950 RepID=A0ABQ6ARM1_9BRAD|nr:hypothetical protein GCM10007857_16080 [Bradyrhizobium iriomotense]